MIEGLFQIAYIVLDLEQAMERFRGVGIRDYHIARGVTHCEHCAADVALAWRGNTMLELVQAYGDGTSVYEQLPVTPEAPIRIHHLGELVGSLAALDELRRTLGGKGRPIFSERDTEKFKAIYADDRKLTGHFYEYIWCNDVGRAILENVPRN